MIRHSQLPFGFTPVRTLTLCTNTLVDVPIPLRFNGVPILLVADGEVPLLWIAAPSYPGSTDWTYVVQASKPVTAGIQVNLDAKTHRAYITLQNTVIVDAYRDAIGTVNIQTLDLRPIGFPVYGDGNGLQVGGMQLRGNRFEGLSVAFEFRATPGSTELESV